MRKGWEQDQSVNVRLVKVPVNAMPAVRMLWTAGMYMIADEIEVMALMDLMDLLFW